VVKVKICGLSTEETLEAALDAGADFIGFVFFPKSPRDVSVAQAAKLAAVARGRAKTVALVVDADDALIRSIGAEVEPDFFQAHGAESSERIAAIRALAGKPVIKAVKVDGARDISAAAAYRDSAAFILYDAKAPEILVNALPGGNGVRFDWALLEGGKAQGAFMLSGGLNPMNVAAAIRATGAGMVDVSSGVESAPGVKDIVLIRNFIEAAKAAR
jgi:phosphoribosylanthranilate isomerase